MTDLETATRRIYDLGDNLTWYEAERYAQAAIGPECSRCDAANRVITEWRHYDVAGSLADLHDALNPKEKEA